MAFAVDDVPEWDKLLVSFHRFHRWTMPSSGKTTENFWSSA